jgi:hypothetical protein
MKCYARFILDSAKPATRESHPDRALQAKLSLYWRRLVPQASGYLGRWAGEPYPGGQGPMATGVEPSNLPTARHQIHTASLPRDRVQLQKIPDQFLPIWYHQRLSQVLKSSS